MKLQSRALTIRGVPRLAAGARLAAYALALGGASCLFRLEPVMLDEHSGISTRPRVLGPPHPPRTLVVALLLLLSVVGVRAQDITSVAPGARVRVRYLESFSDGRVAPAELVGTFLARDSATLRLGDSTHAVSVALRSIRRLDVSQGRRSNALTGALAGALLSAGLHFALGQATGLGPDYELTARAGLLGALIGTP